MRGGTYRAAAERAANGQVVQSRKRFAALAVTREDWRSVRAKDTARAECSGDYQE